MSMPFGDHLPRLAPHHYQGHAVVHWENTIEERRTGWLDELFHARFREILLHAAHRQNLFSPIYCLMPDHFHLIWMGLRRNSDQRLAMKFVREYVNRELEAAWKRASSTETPGNRESRPNESALKPWRLQKQAYDRVLRPEERRRGSVQVGCDYVRLNPVRAGLVDRDADWPFGGCVVPGFPNLPLSRPESWEILWRAYIAERQAEAPVPASAKPELFDGQGDAWLR